MAKTHVESKILQEIVAIVITGLGLLLFLALISYDPGDLGMYRNPPNEVVANFIGPIGVYVAGGLVLFFGTAAYVVPLVMVAAGIRLIFAAAVKDYRLHLLWFALIVFSGCGLLQMLGLEVFPYAPYAGGMVGKFFA
ncbi:MAG: hypothetical protein HC904_11660 [Blastochloris sp.]|nr:hypothetical protein [Blastochloris sp.]